MKVANITQVSNGFIVQLGDNQAPTVSVASNYGQVKKALKEFFDPEAEEQGVSAEAVAEAVAEVEALSAPRPRGRPRTAGIGLR